MKQKHSFSFKAWLKIVKILAQLSSLLSSQLLTVNVTFYSGLFLIFSNLQDRVDVSAHWQKNNININPQTWYCKHKTIVGKHLQDIGFIPSQTEKTFTRTKFGSIILLIPKKVTIKHWSCQLFLKSRSLFLQQVDKTRTKPLAQGHWPSRC